MGDTIDTDIRKKSGYTAVQCFQSAVMKWSDLENRYCSLDRIVFLPPRARLAVDGQQNPEHEHTQRAQGVAHDTTSAESGVEALSIALALRSGFAAQYCWTPPAIENLLDASGDRKKKSRTQSISEPLSVAHASRKASDVYKICVFLEKSIVPIAHSLLGTSQSGSRIGVGSNHHAEETTQHGSEGTLQRPVSSPWPQPPQHKIHPRSPGVHRACQESTSSEPALRWAVCSPGPQWLRHQSPVAFFRSPSGRFWQNR